jgi:hypothetical protein
VYKKPFEPWPVIIRMAKSSFMLQMMHDRSISSRRKYFFISLLSFYNIVIYDMKEKDESSNITCG